MNTFMRGTKRWLCRAMWTACAATSFQAWARPPRAIVERGTIETMDRNTQAFQLQRCGRVVPLAVVWNSRTAFFEGGQSASATDLAKGTPVTIWHRAPLFGARMATKVVIEVERACSMPHARTPSPSAKP